MNKETEGLIFDIQDQELCMFILKAIMSFKDHVEVKKRMHEAEKECMMGGINRDTSASTRWRVFRNCSPSKE